MRDTFKEQLTEAGNKFDGHVTNGSLGEIMKVIQAMICEALDAIDKLAEADICKGNPITGAHHRAIEKYRKTLEANGS